MQIGRQGRKQLAIDLAAAVANRELRAHFQPIACLRTGGITGFEVLSRWNHRELGAVPPTMFIPLAERTGQIAALGEWVLRHACEVASTWKQPLKVAVNLSPFQIEQTDIVSLVETVLTETGLDAERLDLEVTESVLIKSPTKAVKILRRLQDLGVRIAMDDFGTGYSSLGYFRDFPFDKVKIDQSFVKAMTDSREAFAIVKAIIALGTGLGMSIIAEGVETEQQAYLLTAEGCDKAQGYLIGRPAPIDRYAAIVGDYRTGSHPCRASCDSCLEVLRVPTAHSAMHGSFATRYRAAV